MPHSFIFAPQTAFFHLKGTLYSLLFVLYDRIFYFPMYQTIVYNTLQFSFLIKLTCSSKTATPIISFERRLEPCSSTNSYFILIVM